MNKDEQCYRCKGTGRITLWSYSGNWPIGDGVCHWCDGTGLVRPTNESK